MCPPIVGPSPLLYLVWHVAMLRRNLPIFIANLRAIMFHAGNDITGAPLSHDRKH